MVGCGVTPPTPVSKLIPRYRVISVMPFAARSDWVFSYIARAKSRYASPLMAYSWRISSFRLAALVPLDSQDWPLSRWSVVASFSPNSSLTACCSAAGITWLSPDEPAQLWIRLDAAQARSAATLLAGASIGSLPDQFWYGCSRNASA